MAGIRSSLAEAAATAASPTTGIAAAAQDEVSVAIASMFGNFGHEFQALSAQAQAFHEQFVSLMNAGAGAYTSAEAANAAQAALGGGIVGSIGQNLGGGLGGAVQTGTQAISTAIENSPIAAGVLQASGAPAVVNSLNAFGATVAGPYQALVSNTVNNLQAIGSTVTANPFPFLHQIVNNQIGYAQTINSSIVSGIQNLPAELANLPMTIQTGIQGLATFNPGNLLQQFVNNQIGYAQTVVTSLQTAGNDLLTGLTGLPSGLQSVGQALLAGDPVGAGNALGQALENAFLPGFSLTTTPAGLFDVAPLGPLGDLAPIFTIPGQMAQNFTNLLPAGSIPQMMSQNATNLIEALTNFGTTLDLNALSINFGVPLQLVLDGLGGPINALSALNSTGVALGGALQTGNAAGALAAVLDAPAVVTNGFLNGTTALILPPADLGGGLTSMVEIPFGGILTPLALPTLLINILGDTTPLPLLGGTGIGGLIPGLLGLGPQLAGAITPNA
ncbi:PE family protein [Mycobacterium palustre]|nr:PE family protein [Mycobacterium palustre]